MITLDKKDLKEIESFVCILVVSYIIVRCFEGSGVMEYIIINILLHTVKGITKEWWNKI